jgi:hypothetical protein
MVTIIAGFLTFVFFCCDCLPDASQLAVSHGCYKVPQISLRQHQRIIIVQRIEIIRASIAGSVALIVFLL